MPATRGFLPLAALLLAFLPASARAEDAPPFDRSKPPPRPEVAGILDRYLSEDAETRAAAEAALSKSGPEVLRILLHAMRDRVRKAERAAGADAADEAPPSARGVEQDARFVSLPVATAARLLGVPEGAADATHRLLSAAEAKTLLDALGKDAELEVLAVPRVTSFDGQAATIEVIDHGRYVARYEAAAGGTKGASPVVDTYRTGVKVDTTARIVGDDGAIDVRLDLDVRRRGDPVEEEPIPAVGGVTGLRVQRPELQGWTWRRAFLVPKEQSLLATFPPGFASEPGRRLVLLYSAKVVPLDPPPPAPGTRPGAK